MGKPSPQFITVKRPAKVKLDALYFVMKRAGLLPTEGRGLHRQLGGCRNMARGRRQEIPGRRRCNPAPGQAAADRPPQRTRQQYPPGTLAVRADRPDLGASMITRLPTKFGQGHSDAIGFFQDEVLPPLIENKVVCIAVRGILDNGDELQFSMVDCSGERKHNTRLLGLIAELQAELARDLAPSP